MTADLHPSDSPQRVWTAAAVARHLGVAPGTLRSWSQRHGIGPAAHVPGRHRRYTDTDTDVAELEAMRGLIAQGVVLSSAAAIARAQRPDIAAPHLPNVRYPRDTASALTAGPTPDCAVTELVAAAARLEHDTTHAIIAATLAAHGVIEAWEHLCRPALTDLDSAAATNPGCSDAQLLLSWVIGACLRGAPVTPTVSDIRPVLLACAAGEQHTLAIDALFAALTEHDVPTRTLGPAVPTVALIHAVQQLQPAAVLLWAQRPLTARSRMLRRLAPHTDTVLAAGPGWDRTELPPTVTRVNSLLAALGLLTRASATGKHRSDHDPRHAARDAVEAQ